MGTVVGSWRLRLLLILVIFSTSIYGASAIFSNLGGNVDENGYYNWSESGADLSQNQTNIGETKSQNFIDALMGIGNFLTFGVVDNPWARIFLNSIMGLVWITIGYLIFTFVKEWIPFV